MRPSLLAVLLTPLIFVPALTNCSSPGSNNAASNTAANSTNSAASGPLDNVEELGMLVNLPVQPDEVAWKEDPATKQLTAVLRFSSENAARMADEISKNGQPTSETLPVETWYPAELIAQGELTGESTVKGRSFPAEPFLNPPYTKGRISQVENTDYFILQISS